MAEWKNLGEKAKNLTLTGLGKAKDLGESAKLNLDNVSEEENKKKAYAEIGKCFDRTPCPQRATSSGTANWKRPTPRFKPTTPGSLS